MQGKVLSDKLRSSALTVGALSPIASFNRWKELGRHVKRGEKAITLCMPVTCKRVIKEEGPDGNDTDAEMHSESSRLRTKS
jgi:hypothetical protein